ncbi:MAG: right-handed parallel beta-helix repeat-containing protein [Deltaproteobacteria bacterium]|nr:right-handed parallel beta-helix repeat-containing protein [Deltaproteobacteria bacterium]
MHRILSVLLGLTFSVSAAASDGVLEINQACATQTGCFAGDTAGFPVTIVASGSYKLSSNLALNDVNTDGIVLSTDHVSIDLAGFEIRGPVTCSGEIGTASLTCTPSGGQGSGVEVSSPTVIGASVRSGSIRGMGSHGVSLGVQSEVTNLRVRSNASNGINVIFGGNVSANTAYQNGGNGMHALSGSSVSGNTAVHNGGYGIFGSSYSTVSGNTAGFNVSDGIFVYDGATVSNNTASNNFGIGIRAFSGSMVAGNTVRGNASFGLFLREQSAYRDNVVSSNAAGAVSGLSFVNLGNNACDGSTVCP